MAAPIRPLKRAEQLAAASRYDEAAEICRKVLSIAPNRVPALVYLGQICETTGAIDESAALFDRALALQPSDPIRFRRATLLPVVADTPQVLHAARAEMWERLERISQSPFSIPNPFPAVGRLVPHLAYQGENDREIMVKLCDIFRRATPMLNRIAPHCQPPNRPAPGSRIKVGFVSRLLYDQTVGNLLEGIVAGLSREKFEVSVFTADKGPDPVHARIRDTADHVHILPEGLNAAQQLIASAAQDVLIFAGIGMDAYLYFLGFARLAPVQCVTWGHPVTTGLSTMDYFISSVDMEPEGAEDHYSERLVRLRRPSICYTLPRPATDGPTRAELGLDPDSTLYVCLQTVSKMHPEFDDMMAGVLREDPAGRVVLMRDRIDSRHQRLCRRLASNMGETFERVSFVPRQKRDRFIALLGRADVILDPLHFGGGQTSLEAIAVGASIVTLPGRFRRNRITYAYLNWAGVTDTVARDRDDYVRIAAQLGRAPERRRDIRDRILAGRRHVFDSRTPVDELEAFLDAAVRGGPDAVSAIEA
ncbi:MAG: tetratricopeptide repeat protein [Alphaproteobacteria bacterium]|nr:tetratricopeptide repeat protein [Alphaproteobacteria bacterium]